MKTETRHYVCAITDQTFHAGEVFFDIEWEESSSRFNEGKLLDIARKTVSHFKLETPRNKPKTVQVNIFRLEIKNGELKRNRSTTLEVPIPFSRMIQKEYDDLMEELTAGLPKEFRSLVFMEAWDRGHSAGFEECYNIALEFTSRIKTAFNDYQTRMKNRKTRSCLHRI